jgi:hypothetical protein
MGNRVPAALFSVMEWWTMTSHHPLHGINDGLRLHRVCPSVPGGADILNQPGSDTKYQSSSFSDGGWNAGDHTNAHELGGRELNSVVFGAAHNPVTFSILKMTFYMFSVLKRTFYTKYKLTDS